MASACCVDDDLADLTDALDFFALVGFALLDVDGFALLDVDGFALLDADGLACFADLADVFLDLVDAERVGMSERCPPTNGANPRS
jgi:hypothetical protein